MWWLLLGAVASAAAARAVFRRQTVGKPIPAPTPEGGDLRAARVRQAADEWRALCTGLDGVFEDWDRTLADAGSTRETTSGPVWERHGGWYEWRLGNAPPGDDHAPWDSRAFGEVARECARRVTAGFLPDALAAAIRSVAVQSYQSHPELPARQLRTALTGPGAEPVQRAVRELPMLAHAGAPIRLTEAVWLTGRLLHDGSNLAPLSAAAERSLTNVLRTNDDERTYRVEFGDPTAWSSLLSLSYLRQ
jgi:hypothetical protein